MRKLVIAALAGLTMCLSVGDLTSTAEAETLRHAYRRAARTYRRYTRWHNYYYPNPVYYAPGYTYYAPGAAYYPRYYYPNYYRGYSYGYYPRYNYSLWKGPRAGASY